MDNLNKLYPLSTIFINICYFLHWDHSSFYGKYSWTFCEVFCSPTDIKINFVEIHICNIWYIFHFILLSYLWCLFLDNILELNKVVLCNRDKICKFYRKSRVNNENKIYIRVNLYYLWAQSTVNLTWPKGWIVGFSFSRLSTR